MKLINSILLLLCICCTTTKKSNVTQQNIAGRDITVVEKSNSTDYYVPTEDGNFYVLRRNNNGRSGGEIIDTDCLVCKISKISNCANRYCPNVPREQCRSEIERCINSECGTSCSDGGSLNLSISNSIRY